MTDDPLRCQCGISIQQGAGDTCEHIVLDIGVGLIIGPLQFDTDAEVVAVFPPPETGLTRMPGALVKVHELDQLPVTPAHIGRVQELIDAGSLNDKLARQVFEGLVAGEGEPDEIVAARGLELVSDDSALIAALDEAMAANAGAVEKIKAGQMKASGAIIGAVMKATRGQADAARVRELLMERLG